MTILEDIQKHPTEFNISFFMRDFASTLLVALKEGMMAGFEGFYSDIESSSVDFKIMAVTNTLRGCVTEYLAREQEEIE